MHVRTMTKADIPSGLRLKEIAGWNQTEADWTRFLKLSPEGCFVAEADGEICGTVATISHENRFAWIGMVLVDPVYRSKGFGTQLLETAISHLDERRIPTIKLDATPQGKPIYEKLGFAPEYELERWTLRRRDKVADPVRRDSVSTKLLGSILRMDYEVFGADRSFLLKDLHESAPDFTTGICEQDVVEGYAFGRRGSFADQLGPWMAMNADSALRLLQAFLARSTREVIVVDCLKANVFAAALLRSFGFTYARPLTRMYRGPNDHPGRTDLLCAILGPEFG